MKNPTSILKAEKLKKQFLKNLVKTRGNISRAEQLTSCSDRTIHTYRKEDLKFNEAVVDLALKEKQSSLDDLEESMIQRATGKKKINEDTGEVTYSGGSDVLAIWVSKTQMHDRGYTERKQVELTGNVIPIKVIPAGDFSKELLLPSAEDIEIIEEETTKD